MSDAQGWQPDPLGRHEERYLSAGQPTYLVRDGGVESSDPIDSHVGNAPLTAPDAYRPDTNQPTNYQPTAYPPAAYPPAAYPPGPDQSAGYSPNPYPPGAYQPDAYPPNAYQPGPYLPNPYQPTGYEPGAYQPPGYQPPGYQPPGYQPPGYPTAAYPTAGYPGAYSGAYPAPPAKRRRRWIWVTAAVVVAGAIAIGVAAGVSGSSNKKNVAQPVLTPSASDTATTGVVFTSSEGHFRARFPSSPTEQSLPETIGSEQLMIHAALVPSPLTEVAAEDSSVAIPTSQYQTTMRLALSTLGNVTNSPGTTQVATTFQGHPARTATFGVSGDDLSALIFFYSPTRLYYLIAETGAQFDELKTSFVALP